MNKKQKLRYDPGVIEKKWQKKWEEESLYTFSEDPKKKKYYNVVELPYPSGDLHLGHWFAFCPPDVHARFQRMRGYNVFFPNGFDAFGLPAENAAIKRNIHPKDWTFSNIDTMHKQFATMGTMIDWNHEAITCKPEYYRWNQWIFIKMFEKGIAYRSKTLSNWCPIDQTVLANEHVEDGKCWRCGNEVVQKEIEQWFLKITDYADKLLWDNTENEVSNGVDWPKSVREGQNNWIGKSEGAIVEFPLVLDSAKASLEQYSSSKVEKSIKVFTTAYDTIFGVTFMVLAPEHPFVSVILNSVQDLEIPKQVRDDIAKYVKKANKKTELERKENREKTGIFTGQYAIHPFTKKEIPIWIADYVLAGYGTGAIMGVPGHDARDYEFARTFNLPIIPVVKPAGAAKESVILPSDGFWDYPEIKKFADKSVLFNSGEFDGLSSNQAKAKLLEYMVKKGFGEKKINYHLHDWSISRQRYWGTPVPMIHCPNCGIVPVPEKDLPVELPYEVDYTPKGKPPLATATEWMQVTCPKCGAQAQRDAETLDTFFDSSWYFFRYLDPRYNKGPFDEKLAKALMPLDIYFGGSEHTLGHTLYARFFTRFFKDLGLIDFKEFAHKRVQHGVILGPDGNRMSKSKGNVVNPDDVVKEYGADTVRLYLSFMMPYEATAPWAPGAIAGIYRFLRRVWDLQDKCQMSNSKSQMENEKCKMSNTDLYMMHKTIQKVGEDLGSIKFNTAVAALMQWLNHLSRKEHISEEEYKNFLLLLAPFAPHFTEELFQRVVKVDTFRSIHLQAWPVYEEKYLQQNEVIIVVQVNGKLRENLTCHMSNIKSQKELESRAVESEKVKKHLEGKEVKKVIYVEGKIINFVTN